MLYVQYQGAWQKNIYERIPIQFFIQTACLVLPKKDKPSEQPSVKTQISILKTCVTGLSMMKVLSTTAMESILIKELPLPLNIGTWKRLILTCMKNPHRFRWKAGLQAWIWKALKELAMGTSKPSKDCTTQVRILQNNR